MFDVTKACAANSSGGRFDSTSAICSLLAELIAEGRTADPPYEPLKAQISLMAPGVHVR